MTIAAGLLLPSNDIVVAADSQETYPTAKIDGHKILALNDERDPTGCVLFTGAGDSGYLDSLGQKILGVFHDRQDLAKPREFQAAFQAAITEFYAAHVLPFGETWVNNENLAVSTVIAYQRGRERGLFRTSMATVTECAHAAVGTGNIHALSVLNPLRLFPMTTEAALRLVAFATYQAKKRDPFCGNNTDLVLLRRHAFHLVETSIINEWEDLFDELLHYLDGSTGMGLGVIHSSEEQLKAIVNALDGMQARFTPSGVT